MATEIVYSTVIVGSGPFALAVLSRLRESVDDCYRRLNNQEIKPSVFNKESCTDVGDIAVVDPSGSWLQNWYSIFCNYFSVLSFSAGRISFVAWEFVFCALRLSPIQM